MDEGRAADGCARSRAPRLLQLATFVAGATVVVLVLGFDRAGAGASATVVVSSPSFTTLAVDASGTAWGYRNAAPIELWRSEDEGLTWTAVPGWNLGRRPWYLTPLESGTLLIHYDTGFRWAIARSDDDGGSWSQVLALPCIAGDCTTRGHAVAELDLSLE